MKILFLFLVYFIDKVTTSWLSKEVVKSLIAEFERDEEVRRQIYFRGVDRRSSSPFITGNGFRVNASHICDEANACRMHPDKVHNGSCIFVKTDFFEFFVTSVVPRIPGSYKIISHNGDLSAPDGQNDAPRIGMPKYVTTDRLQQEYENGRLIAHHGQNLWWVNKSVSDRPVWSHCLPIGLENRQYAVGKNLTTYVDAWQRFILDRPQITVEEWSQLPLLLVAFYPKSRVPDRKGVLTKLFYTQSHTDSVTGQPFGKWYNETDLDHEGWLSSVARHRFVLCPFGHGLDTHRISEVLLMGGVPVMRRSTISSCYDDSDNEHRDKSGRAVRIHRRGSLPVVILDSWDDLNKTRLENEWKALAPRLLPDAKSGASQWDWRRLFLQQWIDRIGC